MTIDEDKNDNDPLTQLLLLGVVLGDGLLDVFQPAVDLGGPGVDPLHLNPQVLEHVLCLLE